MQSDHCPAGGTTRPGNPSVPPAPTVPTCLQEDACQHRKEEEKLLGVITEALSKHAPPWSHDFFVCVIPSSFIS